MMNASYSGEYSHRTLASLTADDSKILGSRKLKLISHKTQRATGSRKSSILNSSWTPLVNKSANRSVRIF